MLRKTTFLNQSLLLREEKKILVTSAEENNISEPEPIAEGGEEDPVQEDFLIENGVLLEYRGSEEHVTIPSYLTNLPS